MRRLAMLLGAAAFAWALAAAPAAACIYLPVTCIAEDGGVCPVESVERRLARERRESAAETRRRTAEARARLRSGEVDVAAELAELLVPNVRPVRVDNTDCGPIGEVDLGAGGETPDYLFARLVAGTPLAGADMGQFPASVLRRELIAFGEPCNTEFRRGFAAFLRRSMSERTLRRAWLFLAPRQRSDGYRRLMRFEGTARMPPMTWQASAYWLTEEVGRFARRDPAGRSLAAAVDVFWDEQASALGDDSHVCPGVVAEWAALRTRLVPELIAAREARRRRYSRQP